VKNYPSSSVITTYCWRNCDVIENAAFGGRQTSS